jgi:hypothetical protein
MILVVGEMQTKSVMSHNLYNQISIHLSISILNIGVLELELICVTDGGINWLHHHLGKVFIS